MKKQECRFSHKLNAYADGELAGSDFDKVQAHLMQCPPCQIELRELSRLNSFLNTFEEEKVPEHLNQRIMATVNDLEISSKRSWLSQKVIGFSVAASIAVSFFIGIMLADATFQKTYSDNSGSVFSFGQESLYSFYEGGE